MFVVLVFPPAHVFLLQFLTGSGENWLLFLGNVHISDGLCGGLVSSRNHEAQELVSQLRNSP